jgi:hypothetical protein
MANGTYNEGAKRIFNGGIDLDTSAIQVMLVKSTYVFDPDHAAIDDGSANDPASHEISVSGYARQTLASRTVGKDDPGNYAYLDADDTAFGALAGTQIIGAAIIFYNTGLDTTSIPIALFDLPDTTTNGSAVTIVWAAVGSGGVLKGQAG